MARQDSRHRSPEKGRDAKCTYCSEIGTVNNDRPCYQNAWWTFAKENPLVNYKSENATLPWWSEEAIQGHPKASRKDFIFMETDCAGSSKVARPNKKGFWWIWSKTESAKPNRNMHSGKPELKHHQQSFLRQTSLVLSAADSLELILVSSAILEHINNNTDAFDSDLSLLVLTD